MVYLFRGLGIETDCDILSYIAYNLEDQQLIERFRPSLDEVNEDYNTQIACLKQLANRSGAADKPLREKLKRARVLLERFLLPHVGTEV